MNFKVLLNILNSALILVGLLALFAGDLNDISLLLAIGIIGIPALNIFYINRKAE